MLYCVYSLESPRSGDSLESPRSDPKGVQTIEVLLHTSELSLALSDRKRFATFSKLLGEVLESSIMDFPLCA